MELMFEIVPVCIAGCYIATVTAFFLVVRSNLLLLRIGYLMAAITIFIALKIIYSLGYKITKNSRGYLDSFVQNIGPKTAVDRKFFRSCKELNIDIGKFFKIKRNTFPSVMHEIIINATINLLVAIPNQNKPLL